MNIFSKLFNSKKQEATVPHQLLLNENLSSSILQNGVSEYDNDVFRSAVDSIGRNVGKLKGVHLLSGQTQSDELGLLLQYQPNEYMNSFDLLYKVCTHYYIKNNAFILISRDDTGAVQGFYPVDCIAAEFVTDAKSDLYINFKFEDGTSHIFSYADIIHLRRHFNKNKLLGDSNSALSSTIELAAAQNHGLINSIRQSANIKGILNYEQIVSSEKLKQEKEEFIKDFLSMQNNGGIVVTDPKRTYTPISNNPTASISSEDMKVVRTKIYDYLGINEHIVNSTYTEDEYSAFYESVVEPFALQLSLEFSRKVFTSKEREYGNSIVFESGRLQYSNNQTKIKMIETLFPCGLLSINQALEILNLPPVKDGDKRLQTLNLIDMEKATDYQMTNVKKVMTVATEEGTSDEQTN